MSMSGETVSSTVGEDLAFRVLRPARLVPRRTWVSISKYAIPALLSWRNQAGRSRSADMLAPGS